MHRNSRLWLWLIPLLFTPGCSRPPSRDLPATMVWHTDQDLISPAGGAMNVWEGLSVKPDGFSADGAIAQFILWRKREARTAIFIEYSLQGRTAEWTVNGGEKRMLAPSSSFRWEMFEARLVPGFNFLRISKKSKDRLRIRAIAVGARSRKPEPHLNRGESFSVYLRPGRGRIELFGSGRVRIAEQELAAAPPPPRVSEIASGWFSRKISYDIVLSRPATVSVSSLRGHFMVGSYSYREDARTQAGGKPRFQGKPDIYIILADACQAAHLGAYGYGRGTSPHIDAFARDAMVYENAYANAAFTRSSVATLLTGLYPDSHKVRILQHELPGRLLTLPEYLNARGYRTAIYSSSSVISPPFGLKQGVDDFVNVRGLKFEGSNPNLFNGFAGWLGKTASPRFAYVHFMNPHLPSVPAPGFVLPFAAGEKVPSYQRMIALTEKAKDLSQPFSAGELRELVLGYDASIAWMDGEFGKIIAALKQKNVYDGSLVIFLADHGEAMKEHGVISHGSNVYEETTRVPLIVKYPGSLGLKGRYLLVSEIADIFPTISGLLGQELNLDGRSLLARAADRAYDDALAVCRSFNPAGLYGLRWKNWYDIICTKDAHRELFRLDADPRLDVSRRYPQVTEYFEARFLDWYGRFRNRNDFATKMNLKNLPAGDIEEMKTLGYL
jgi:arylsulfatase A-like enzyme